MGNTNITLYYFEQSGYIPNHSFFPAVLYRKAVDNSKDNFESIFKSNNWTNSWRDGVFNFHHYHSNTHEVIGVRKGSGLLIIGGEGGSKIVLNSGDVLILPAGTGHKKLSSSPDFEVVGAYPFGEEYNLKKDRKEDLEGVHEEIANALYPEADPIHGDKGPLVRIWREA